MERPREVTANLTDEFSTRLNNEPTVNGPLSVEGERLEAVEQRESRSDLTAEDSSSAASLKWSTFCG